MPSDRHFKILKTEMLPDSEAAITGEIALPFLHTSRAEALEHLNKHTELPGFRPGHIPEDVLTKKLGEMRVWEETAEVALAREYANIIEESNIKAIGRPAVSIT